MLRNVIALAAAVGAAASLPILYESNPDAFDHAIRTAAQQVATAPELPIKVSALRVEPAEKALPSGRRMLVKADGSGHYVTPIRVNGRTVDGMIDTGATHLTINQSTARKLGVAVKSADFIQRVNTANGQARAALVRVPSIQIGRIVVDEVDAVVLEDKALSSALVGMSFLSRLKSYGVKDGAMELVQ